MAKRRDKGKGRGDEDEDDDEKKSRGQYIRFPKGDMSKQKALQLFKHRVLSIRFPWAFVMDIVAGTKRTENRDWNMGEAEGEWIGLHVSHTYPAKQACIDALENELIVKALQKVKGGMYRNRTSEQLLTEFKQYKGSIIGAFKATSTEFSPQCRRPFKDYPKPAKCHWYITDIIWFDEPILAHKGRLTWSFITRGPWLKKYYQQVTLYSPHPILYFSNIFAIYYLYFVHILTKSM